MRARWPGWSVRSKARITKRADSTARRPIAAGSRGTRCHSAQSAGARSRRFWTSIPVDDGYGRSVITLDGGSRIQQTKRPRLIYCEAIMQDDFDNGLGLGDDDEHIGGSAMSDTGDLGAGAAEGETEGGGTGRRSGGGRKSSSGSRKSAGRKAAGGRRKTAAKGAKKATRKAAAKGGRKAAGRKGAKAKKGARKGAKKKGGRRR